MGLWNWMGFQMMGQLHGFDSQNLSKCFMIIILWCRDT